MNLIHKLFRPYGIRAYSSATGSEKYVLASRIASFFTILKNQDPDVVAIPPNFIVPKTNVWPAELHGLDIYTEAVKLRKLSKLVPNCHDLKTVNILNTLNFAWSRKQEQGKLLVLAMKYYKQLNGHLSVPPDFIIGENDTAYPMQVRGMKLGYKVKKVRRGSYPEFYEEISALGFIYDDAKERVRLVLIALSSYKAKYGNLFIPRAYVIREGDSNYPLEVQGMQLGIIVSNVRKGCFKQFYEEFARIGFIFDMREFARLAIVRYYTLNTNKKKPIKRDFVVPCNSKWPEEMWNLPLGALNTGCIWKPKKQQNPQN